jgi:predicted ATPase
VVAAYRIAEMSRTRNPFLQVRSDLLSRGICTELQLKPLTREQVEQYLANERTAPPSAEEAASLHARSDGNPLFMRELHREGGATTEAIRQMVWARMDRLDDTHRQLLVTASVQGREFDSFVLASTMRMASQDVEEALQDLDEVHGFIHRIREEELPDGKFTVRYRFVYSLYQEACYASLAPTRKASISSALAGAFLACYGQ